MIGVALAVFSAMASALSVVLMRKRLNESSPLNVALIITCIGNIILWPPALLFTNLGTVNLEAVCLFAIGGAFAPGICRLLYLKGMNALGASVNACVLASYPLWISIFAVLFLSEVLSPINWVGIICIIFGVTFTQRSLGKTNGGERKISKSLVFPILSTLMAASAYLIKKQGLNIYNEPVLGVAVGYTFSLLLYVLLLISSGTARRSLSLREDVRSVWKSGVGLSLGYLLAFYALSYEKVSIVTPLLQTEVLFVIFFAYVYSKESEHISRTLIISAFIIILGVVLTGIL